MQNFASRSLFELRSHWLNWTKPHRDLQDQIEQVRAQALSSILLAILIVGVLFEISSIFFNEEIYLYLLTDIVAIFCLSILFLTSRTKHYKVTAYVAAVTISLVSFAETVISAYQPSMVFMILSFFIAATALPTREALLIAILNIFFAMTVPIFVPEWDSLDDIIIELTFIILSTLAFYALMFIQRYYIHLHEEKSQLLANANKMLEEQVTSLTESRLALEKSEQNFSKIFRSSPDPIAINNLETGVFIDYNNSFLKQSGYTSEDLQKMIASDLWPDPDSMATLVSALKHQGYIYELETAFKTKSGEMRDAIISAEMIELNGENCVVSTARDMTLYKQAQREHQVAERERERSAILREFVTAVSHDFRTPLSTIITSLYLLEKAHEEERRQKHLTTISNQVHRIESLVEALITMAMLDDESTAFQFYPIDLNKVVSVCVQELKIPHNLEIKLDLTEDLPHIEADSGQLEKAFLHIFKNAIRFTPENGTILISTQRHESSVQVICKDTGSGIDQVDLPHIFERLYRGDKARNDTTGGSGLGLSISRKIIERHNGIISVNSELGQGSEFIVTLPIILN